ncbi:MAG: thioredoxin family protein [Chloroflexi bacterium]|nr:MAG: thioredoxin family protein [Chloroflexota bacterium]
MATESSVRNSQLWAQDHPLPFGSKAPAFELLEPATGRKWRSTDLDRTDVLAVYFICNHCPHSLAWEDRLLAIARDFSDSVSSVFIDPSDPVRLLPDGGPAFPEDAPENVAAHAREKHFPAPYLVDPDQTVADDYAAVRTPHAFVFTRAAGLVYRGTVDDNEEDPSAVTTHYLRDALEDAAAGRSVRTPETPLQGCGIKRSADQYPGKRG